MSPVIEDAMDRTSDRFIRLTVPRNGADASSPILSDNSFEWHGDGLSELRMMAASFSLGRLFPGALELPLLMVRLRFFSLEMRASTMLFGLFSSFIVS